MLEYLLKRRCWYCKREERQWCEAGGIPGEVLSSLLFALLLLRGAWHAANDRLAQCVEMECSQEMR